MAMFRRGIIAFGLAGQAIAPLALAPRALAQDRPVRMIVPFAPGSPVDVFARRLAARMQTPLGQPVLVENQPGTAGVLEVVRARPDGQTILFGTAGTLALYPLLTERARYDPLTDLAPVSLVGAATLAIAVAREGAADLAGFLADARARPGQRRFGSPGAGSFARLTMDLLKSETGEPDLPHVMRTVGAPAMDDLLHGRVDAVIDTAVAALGDYRAGRIRILAVASAGRSALLPEVPTVREALGLPGFEAAAWMAVMLPVGVPASMRDRLAYAINSTLSDGHYRAALGRDGFEVGALLSPPEIGRFLLAEQARWRPVARASGVRIE